jgi:hypothetical protein
MEGFDPKVRGGEGSLEEEGTNNVVVCANEALGTTVLW